MSGRISSGAKDRTSACQQPQELEMDGTRSTKLFAPRRGDWTGGEIGGAEGSLGPGDDTPGSVVLEGMSQLHQWLLKIEPG
jgi:hypothetical protein